MNLEGAFDFDSKQFVILRKEFCRWQFSWMRPGTLPQRLTCVGITVGGSLTIEATKRYAQSGALKLINLMLYELQELPSYAQVNADGVVMLTIERNLETVYRNIWCLRHEHLTNPNKPAIALFTPYKDERNKEDVRHLLSNKSVETKMKQTCISVNGLLW